MKIRTGDDIASLTAAHVPDGVQSLSVLATPEPQRADAVYELSDDAREVLQRVLRESLNGANS